MKYSLFFWIIISLQTNAQNNENANNLLLSSALHGNVKDIKKAIKLGANLNVKNEKGGNPDTKIILELHQFI